jgi:hypothetical protein
MDMNLIIGGHIRSGTSLLRRICNSHPDILLTLEFRCYAGYKQHYLKNLREIFRGVRLGNFGDYIYSGQQSWQKTINKSLFASRYMFELGRKNTGKIDGYGIDYALRRCLPGTKIVGDKFPNYVYMLDQLSDIEDLVILIICRDPRDVVSSTLIMIKKIKQNWTRHYDSADKVTRRWLRAVELMEGHAGRIFHIQYENLVNHPREVTTEIGEFLDVDPSGFTDEIVHTKSLNKHQKHLSKEDLKTVLSLAGPMMTRLGYT